MAGFGEAIWQLMGHQNPELAMLQAMQGGGGTPPAPGGTPDAGGTDPGTGAPAPTPQPAAYQSPPDLLNLYQELAQRDAFANSINTGTGLILSGLAKPENRDRLMEAFAGGGGSDSASGGGGSDPLEFMSGVMKIQQAQEAQRRMAATRAALPEIAKTYGLDTKTATYLLDTGKLDSVIAELEKPSRTTSTDPKTGQTYVIDLNTGEIVGDPIGQPKPRETEIVTDDNTGEKFAVYKDTKERVGGDPLVKGQRKTEYIDSPDGKGGKVLVYSDNREPVAGGAPIAAIAAPPRKTVYITKPDGSQQLVYEDDKSPVTNPNSVLTIGAPPKEVTFIDDGKGGKKAVYKDGTPVPDKDIPGLGATEQEQLYNAAKAGSPDPSKFPDLQTWLDQRAEKSRTQVNIDQRGNNLPDPPKDMAWKFDKDGNVMINPDTGAPIAVRIENSKLDEESDAAAAKAGLKDLNATISGTVVGQDIDRAIDNVMKTKDDLIGSTGWSALMGSWVPGSEAKQLSGNLATIKANIGIDALQRMRNSNETGAGLGNISDTENRIMQDTFGNLDPTGRPEDIIYNLRRVKAIYGAILTKGIKDDAEAQAILSAVPYPTPEEMSADYVGDSDPTKVGGPDEDEPIEKIIERNRSQ